MKLLCITHHPDGETTREAVIVPDHSPIPTLLAMDLIDKVTIHCANGNAREYQEA